MDAALAALQEDTADAVRATSGVHWSLAERLPFVGSTVDAVATLAEVSDDLAHGPLDALVSVAEAVNPATVAPQDGAVRLGPLQDVAAEVVGADTDLEVAQQRVAGIDDTLMPQVDDAVASVDAELAEVRSTTATAARAALLLPAMLGAQGERKYLVLVQSNAEPRALGGIPGAFILLRAEDGEVTIEDQRAASSLGVFDAPVLDLDESESALFGDKLARFGQNVTMTPDFPRAAALAREMWRERTGVAVDGVLSLDPVALADVLAVDGPIEVPDGRELEGEKLVRFLLHGVYLGYPDPREQDEVFADVARSAFERVMSGSADTSGVLEALARSTREGRVMLWSADADEQKVLDGTVLDGSLRGIQGDATPVVGVYSQLTRAAKMGWFLDSDVEVEVVADRPDGSHELAVTVSYTNTATRDEARGLPRYVAGMGDGDPGEIRMNSLVYAPAGGRIMSAHDNGRNVGLFPQAHHRLIVGARTLDLAPGETNSVTYVMITGKHQSGDVAIRSTPGARAQR
ncbi:DUF4012 domain-containing protein [Isoptericola sp. NPDC058082]|uniref:DUF4012 domain-containing protein n=1 Tax=Isoptericola sp. NPDC058082 TaxID=3346331 RepID=UPI0036E4EEC7